MGNDVNKLISINDVARIISDTNRELFKKKGRVCAIREYSDTFLHRLDNFPIEDGDVVKIVRCKNCSLQKVKFDDESPI